MSKKDLSSRIEQIAVASGINISLNSFNCSVNPQFWATPIDARHGGAFIILPHNVQRVPADYPLVVGHEGAVLDVAFCPTDDFKIASASEDKKVCVWKIPFGGLEEPMEKPLHELVFHKLRVLMVVWHPKDRNTLLSASADKEVVIWDIAGSVVKQHIQGHMDILHSVCFNSVGTRLVTTSKDKMLRIFEIPTGKCLSTVMCHDTLKKTSAIFLREDKVFTTGFDHASLRQYSVRDANDLSQGETKTLPRSTHGLLVPLYDSVFNILFLCGRGDYIIECYEVRPKSPFLRLINNIRFSEPMRGVCMMPSRGCSVKDFEAARLYRLDNSGSIHVASLTLSKLLFEHMYPVPKRAPTQVKKDKLNSTVRTLRSKKPLVPSEKLQKLYELGCLDEWIGDDKSKDDKTNMVKNVAENGAENETEVETGDETEDENADEDETEDQTENETEHEKEVVAEDEIENEAIEEIKIEEKNEASDEEKMDAENGAADESKNEEEDAIEIEAVEEGEAKTQMKDSFNFEEKETNVVSKL